MAAGNIENGLISTAEMITSQCWVQILEFTSLNLPFHTTEHFHKIPTIVCVIL